MGWAQVFVRLLSAPLLAVRFLDQCYVALGNGEATRPQSRRLTGPNPMPSRPTLLARRRMSVGLVGY